MTLKHFMRRTFVPVLNIIGMSISLMVFLVLFAQVWFDYSYNRNFDDYRNIYRYERPVYEDASMSGFKYTHIVRKEFIDRAKANLPDIVSICDYADEMTDMGLQMYFKEDKFDIPWTYTDTDFPKVFGLEIVAGSIDEYDHANAAIISESQAKLIFSDNNPVGETLMLEMLQYEYNIVGVYKDMPENCFVMNGLLVNDGGLEDTFFGVHTCFFHLSAGASPEDVLNSIPDCEPDSRLTPITATHFLDDTQTGGKKYANRTQMLILMSISLLFLVISIFNYVNFSIASIPFRINKINVEKVYGANRGRLIFKQLKVNIAICLVSFTFAVGLMEIVSGSQFASFSACSLAVADNIGAIFICLIVAMVAAVTGGLVTALYSTSFSPGMVLKGEFSISGKGTSFRRVSMVLQFVLSCVFLICGLMISRQTDYMVNQDNGFNSEEVLHMKTILFYPWHNHFDEIKSNPEIVEVTTGAMPMEEGLSSRQAMLSKDKIDVWFSFRSAHWSYFDFFNFKLIDGRFPKEGEINKAIINETFAQTYPDHQIGGSITYSGTEFEIIGIIQDFNARPLMHKREPVVYNIADYGMSDVFFKLKTDNTQETIKWLEKTLGGVFSFNGDNIPWESSFLEDDIEELYHKEIGQSRLIRNSSLLCLLIALIGVLGIVYFETQVMRKEIAIRKVNGATTWEIIRSILCRYLLVSSIGFVIALPLSILIMNWWLSSFAFRADMPIWLFVIAYLLITTLTAAVVALRSYASASENPVNALKKE